MFLNITNTGTQINQELVDYLNINYPNVGYNQVYIQGVTLDKYKQVNIIHSEFKNTAQNTICVSEENLNQNIIDWLNTL